jgi:hypothetical protein
MNMKKVTLLKTDGKYYLYKTAQTFDVLGEVIFFELYLGSIISGVNLGYVTGIDGFEPAVQAVEDELEYLAKEELKEVKS